MKKEKGRKIINNFTVFEIKFEEHRHALNLVTVQVFCLSKILSDIEHKTRSNAKRQKVQGTTGYMRLTIKNEVVCRSKLIINKFENE